MKPNSSFHITVGDFEVEVRRKRVKNLNLRVSPPDGRIRISAPPRASRRAIEDMVAANRHWIRRHQARLQARAGTPSPDYVTGEIHYFLGAAYRLDVIERSGAPSVTVPPDGRLVLAVRPGSDTAHRERVLREWYRGELKRIAPPRVAEWAAEMGLKPPETCIKRMKTRWGTCNIRDRRIWLNLDLIRHAPACLDYVIVHELAHFFERRHNARFRAILDRTLPDWRRLRTDLNAGPSHQPFSNTPGP